MERLYGGFANRMVEEEQGPRVATPGLAEEGFDYRSNDPCLASGLAICRGPELLHT